MSYKQHRAHIFKYILCILHIYIYLMRVIEFIIVQLCHCLNGTVIIIYLSIFYLCLLRLLFFSPSRKFYRFRANEGDNASELGINVKMRGETG